MKIKEKFNKLVEGIKKRPLLFIILLSLVVRLFYLSMKHPLWWDSHVYIGMGKYIFSGGRIGIWESFRPLIHPIILGMFWKMKINPIFIGKLLDLIFSLTSIYLTYLVGKKVFNRTIGLISSLIFSLTALFIMFTGLILTEPLAITLSLLGIYYFLDYLDCFNKWRLFFAGIFLSLAFMTKFPQGIIFGVLFLILLFRKKVWLDKIKSLTIFSFGFAIVFVPYLIFNYFRYPNMFEPFISGSWIVTTSTWVYGQGVGFYLTNFFFRNLIYAFFFVYIYYYFKEKHWRKIKNNTIFFSAIFFLLYFTFQVPRKEVRYLVTTLPLLTTMISYVVVKIYYKLKKRSRPTLRPLSFVVLCVIITIIHIPTTLHLEQTPTFEKEIIKVIEDNQITAPILTTDPSFVSFVDQPVVILSAGLQFGPQIYEQEQGKYGLLFLNDCDLICPPQNNSCLKRRENFMFKIATENKEIFNEKYKNCSYYIYLPK
jgi:hypothetical protein